MPLKKTYLALFLAVFVTPALALDAPGYELKPLSDAEDNEINQLIGSGELTIASATKRYNFCSASMPDDVVGCIKNIKTPDWLETGTIDPITDEAQYASAYAIDETRIFIVGCSNGNDLVAFQSSTALKTDVVSVTVRLGLEEPVQQMWERTGDSYGARIQGKSASELIAKLGEKDRIALRYYGISGEETLLIDLTNFLHDNARVARDCKWTF